MITTFEIYGQNDIPTDGLELWLKADQITASDYTDIGGGVLRLDKWVDQSGNGYYVNNDNSENGIIYQTGQVNSLPAVLFPSTAHEGLILKNSSDNTVELLLENYEVFIVLKANATTGNVGFYAGGNATRSLYGKWNGAQFYFRGPDNNLANTDNAPWPISDNWGLISFQRNTTDQTSYTSNGGLLTSLPNNTSNTDTHKFGSVGGANQSTTLGWDGYIAEVIVYNKTAAGGTDLDPVTRLRVNDYLTNKYGFTHAEFSDTDELFNNNTTPNQNMVVYGNDGGNYTPDRVNPSTSLGVGISATSDGDYIILGETNEGGLTFDYAPNDSRIWAKKFYLQKNGNLTVNLNFNVQNYEGKPNDYDTGSGPERTEADYYLVYSSDNSSTYTVVPGPTVSFIGSNIVSVSITDAQYDINGDGFYTLASTAPDAFYTKSTGNWTDTDIWTKNPSGFADGTNTYPSATDDVFILAGGVITLNSSNISAGILEVNQGGTLVVGSTTGHNFLEVKGKGTIKVDGDNFPSPGSATAVGGFLTADGGTVEFNGTGTVLTNNYAYHNVNVEMDNASDELIIATDLTLTDSLKLSKGKVTIGTSDNSNQAIDLNVTGNVRVLSEATLGVGTDDVIHNIVLKGSLFNTGEIALTNRADIKDSFTFGSPGYLTELETYFSNNLSGEYAIITFDADQKDQDMVCNGSTILYQIVVDKGASDYYNLNISADTEGRFEMYGYNTHSNGSTGGTDGSMTTSNGMFVMKYGTIHFGNNIYIPSYANTTGNYDLGFGCRLWVDDGADVNFGPVNALTVYGNVLVTGGRLNIGLNSDGTSNGRQNSITLREKGFLVQEGGNVFLNQIKTSILGEDHQGSVTMSGGEMTIYGYVPSSDVAALSLPYNTNSFNMSGGTITIHNQDSDMNLLTKFAMDDGFYSITGGEIIFDINTDRDVSFVSSIPFYNLTVTTDFPARNVTLSDGVGSFGDPISNDGDLKVLNHLVVEENSNVQVGNFDVTISGDLTLYNDAQLNIGSSNTLTFNGDGLSHYLDVRDTDTPYSVNNLVIDLPNSSDIFKLRDFSDNSSVGDTRLKVLTSLSLTQGTFDYSKFVIEVEGDLDFQGRIGASNALGHIKLNNSSGSTQNITASYELVEEQIADTTNVGITHLWLNNTDGFNLNKNLYTTKLTWEEGTIKTNEYGVVIGALGMNDQGSNAIGTNNKVILGTGNSSDGGLSYFIHSNGTYNYPLASEFDTPVVGSYKYTPASITTSGVSEQGFIQLAINNGSLVEFATDPDDASNILDYYWRSNVYEYTSDANKPDITLTFNYNDEDLIGTESDYVAGRILLEGDYSRSVLGTVTEASNTINFSTASKPNRGMYSAGDTDQFTGQIQVYYSFRGTGADGNDVSNIAFWNENQRWTTNADWKTTGPGTVAQNSGEPGKGDIAVIGFGSWNGSNYVNGAGHRVRLNGITREVALLRFEEGDESSTFYVEENSNGLPEVRIQNNSELTAEVVEDIGRFRIFGGTDTDGTDRGVLNGNDMNDFLSEEKSELMIQNQSGNNGGNPFNDFVIPIFPKYPTLRLYGGSTGGEYVFDDAITEAVQIKRMLVEGLVLRLDKSLDVEGTINIGGFQEGNLIFDASTAIQVTCQNIKMENIYSASNSAENKILTEGTDDVEHRLIVKEGISVEEITAGDQNNIEFDLYNGATGNRVILELRGEDNGRFINFYPSEVIPDLYKIVMNKGASQTPTFTMSTNFTLPSSTTEELITLSNGTLILDNSSINITPFAVPSSSWNLASTAGLTLNQGIVNVEGDEANLLLGGKLMVSGGTLNLSNSGQENSIIYAASGEIEMTAGAINIGSELRRDLAGNDASITYKQSGGVFSAGLIGNPNSATRGTFEVVGSSSTFDFNGGEIIVSSGKVTINAASSSVSESAELKLGNNITTESIDAELANEVGKLELINDVTVEVVINDVQLSGDLEIPASATLNFNGKNLSIKGSITNNGTVEATSTTLNLISSDDQSIGGTNAITTQNMVVFTDGSTVNMNADINITEDLTISSGILADNAQTIYVGGDLSVVGTHSTTSTGRIKLNGSSSQDMNITGSLGRLEIDNVAGINLTNSLNLVADEIVFTNGVLNIDQFSLNLGTNVILTATTAFDENNMIQLSGSNSAQGVKITLPSTEIVSEKLLPIGYSGIYAPIGIIGDYNEAELIVKPINTRHTVAENQGDNNEALNQYWRLEFSKADVTVPGDRYISIYYSDININGTEADYIGIIINDAAEIQKNVQKTLDVANNRIDIDLASSLVTGDYFAGDVLSTPDDIIRYRLASGITDAVLNDVSTDKWEISKDNGSTYSKLENEASPSLTSGTIIEVPLGTNLTTTTDGTLGFKTYYKAIIEGTFIIEVNDRQINFDAVEGAGTVKYFVNNDKVGQMPNANWESFYNSGGSIIVEGNASNATLSLNAPLNNNKLTIGGLSLIGTSTGQVWEIPVGNGLNMPAGQLSVDNVEFDLSTSSDINTIEIINTGKLTVTSTTTVNGNVNVDVGDANDGVGATLNISSSTMVIKGDLTVDTDGGLSMVNSNLDAENNITFNSGSTIALSTGAKLAVGGNFTDNGTTTATFTGSTLSFNGASGNQTFTGTFTSGKAINNLEINKASGEVILAGGNTKEVTNLTLNSALNNSGNDDGSLLILGNSISGSSYVSGPLSKKLDVNDSFIFPVGSGGALRTLALIYTENVLDEGDSEKTWTVEYGSLLRPVGDDNIDDASGIANVSEEYQWRVTDIDEGGNATTKKSKAEIYAYYSGLGKDPNYILAIWDDLDFGTPEWKKAGDPLHNAETYFETEDVSFSEKFLAIAAVDETTELPVELIEFNAYAEEEQVRLDWSTASEENNDEFEVQRSLEGKSWNSIGLIQGAGNSNVRLDYEFFDTNPVMNQITYYRLIQRDFDGTETVYEPVQVYMEGKTSVADIAVYPNPTQGEKVNLLLKSWTGEVEIGLFNTLGYKVLEETWTYEDSQLTELEVNNLPRGVYLLRLKSGKTIKSKRVIIE
ncbi:hypothetical protein AVL50_07825 [Flammeovirga sp. SJP92]|nr:hypothetical protein AVL50_07825 [Flammeovirga sp. SJP92]